MYKDKDKQREANRQAAKQYRDKRNKAIEGMTNESMTTARKNVIPKGVTNQGVTDKALPSVGLQEYCKKVYAVNFPKRGKDIKCFADLHPGTQQTINIMSTTDDGKIDQTIKANRTAIAISYQHMFPDRYYPRGVVISGLVIIGKPGDEDYNGICTPEWRAERGR